MTIVSVGARRSPLSQTQVNEVLHEMRKHYPDLAFDITYTDTSGDKDLHTSLRSLDKTDFFTKEIDTLVLQGRCRVGIHSAKDLPNPLPKGLIVIALTAGMDPADVLVIPQKSSLEDMPEGAVIATSSERREESVRQLRSDFQFVDIRGTIGQRLAKLEAGEVDGVVIAEAALLRLGLTHLNRIRLPGDTARYQGQLAVVAREDDSKMQDLFSCIDSRPCALYLGLKKPLDTLDKKYIHYPVIRIIPRSKDTPDIAKALKEWSSYTHVIFTSQQAVKCFDPILDKIVIAVGKSTAASLAKVDYIAQDEHAEGILAVLDSLDLKNAHIFWPHSSLSRPLIHEYLQKRGIKHRSCIVYDTIMQRPKPIPNLAAFNEIIFTSPSTVQGFLEIFGSLPKDKVLTSIGPVTSGVLQK